MQEILFDSVLDCLRLLPFLYVSYLAVEYAEHKMSSKTKQMIYRAGKAGPLLGSLIGIIPQCGFSAAAAGLFAGRMISPGTLLAVFLSTSDEMLPIMLSEGIPVRIITNILLAKVLVGTITGLAVDLAAEKLLGRKALPSGQPEICEHDHCGCGEGGIFFPALRHTAQTALFLFLITLAIGFGMEWSGVADGAWRIGKIPGVAQAAAGLVGMIPNCAASVLVTQLYLEGIINSGALFSGLLCGAGTGLLVLYRENRSLRQNLAITAALYLSGVLFGVFLGMWGILSP